MRASIIAGIFAFVASQVTAQYTNQSPPFYLIVHSKNTTIDGSSLGACHEGAAIEGLCLEGPITPTSTPYSTYQFNTSSFSTQGYLTYTLSVNDGTLNVSEPMQLSYDPTTNVAVPLFEPADYGTLVGFDASNMMYIQGYADDTVTPPSDDTVKDYYRWYVCETYAGYEYTTLAWVLGSHSPENPSCVKVDVVRVFT